MTVVSVVERDIDITGQRHLRRIRSPDIPVTANYLRALSPNVDIPIATDIRTRNGEHPTTDRVVVYPKSDRTGIRGVWVLRGSVIAQQCHADAAVRRHSQGRNFLAFFGQEDGEIGALELDEHLDEIERRARSEPADGYDASID